MPVRPLCLVSLLLYTAFQANIFAADAPPVEATPPKTTAAEASKDPVRQSPAALPPVKQFIPTEKIQADSAVSFPVDI